MTQMKYPKDYRTKAEEKIVEDYGKGRSLADNISLCCLAASNIFLVGALTHSYGWAVVSLGCWTGAFMMTIWRER